VRYPARVRGAASYAGNLLALVRRGRADRQPRVRVRIAHAETSVLSEDAPVRARVLSLSEQLVSEYGRQPRGAR
jgi:hypothetical protein